MKKEKKLTQKQIRKLEKRETKKRFKEWTEMVKGMDHSKCAICGKTEFLHVHHILPREIKEFRFELENGICLCANHHRFSLEMSPHRNPFAFFKWFDENRLPQSIRLHVKYLEHLKKKKELRKEKNIQ